MAAVDVEWIAPPPEKFKNGFSPRDRCEQRNLRALETRENETMYEFYSNFPRFAQNKKFVFRIFTANINKSIKWNIQHMLYAFLPLSLFFFASLTPKIVRMLFRLLSRSAFIAFLLYAANFPNVRIVKYNARS